MKKTYLVKGDHWNENFKCYSVFNESDSTDLAHLSSCFAAAAGSGWVKPTNLTEWGQNLESPLLNMNYGPSGDFSIKLKKKDGYLQIDLEGDVFEIALEKFVKLSNAWEQIVEECPVVIEFGEVDGVYAFLSSKGHRVVVE